MVKSLAPLEVSFSILFMVKKEKDIPKGYYKAIYPSAWNQFEFRARARERVEKKLEILLAISGVLAAILLSNPEVFRNNHFVWFSIVLLSSIFLISLYEFITPHKDLKKLFWFPSVENKEMGEFKKNNDVDGFYRHIVEECYALEGKTNEYVARRHRLISIMVFMLLFSVFVPVAYEIYTNYNFFFSGAIVGFAFVLYFFYKASFGKN